MLNKILFTLNIFGIHLKKVNILYIFIMYICCTVELYEIKCLYLKITIAIQINSDTTCVVNYMQEASVTRNK